MESFASDRYRVLAPLGHGGMAEVFLAVATGAEGFQKPVVIKRIHPHLASNEDVARMFLAEARLAMHLSHQNIVSVFDVGRGPEGLYLVMELVDGWDLGLVLGHEAKARRWMPEALALHVVTQAVNGLQHAYRKTDNGRPVMTAHRDLTPSNILVTVDGEVKIADFGIAKVESGHTEPGSFKGKIPYAAPEVIQGEAATHLSDQFSLGVVLHRLTSGQYPYGYSDNAVVFLDQLSRAGPPPCPGLSQDCTTLVRRMLSISPGRRYSSIEEVGQVAGKLLARSGTLVGAPQLARFVAGLELPAAPSSRVPRNLPSPPEPAPGTNRVPSAGAGEDLEADWKPHGRQLDTSGRLSGSLESAHGGEPAAASPGDEPFLTGPDQMAPPYWQPPPSPPPAPEAASPSIPEQGYEPLPNHYGRRVRRPFPLGLLLVAILLLGGGAAFVLGSGTLRSLLRKVQAVAKREQAVLTILSEPSGAQVRIDGKVVGQTPLSQDNLYPPGVELEVQVTLRGYKPWKGKLRGGEVVTLDVELRR